MKNNLFFLAVFAAFACNGQIKKNKNSAYLNELVSTMQGTYSSAKQAKVDSTYFDISLKMIPIWKDRGDYLYVEQALTNKQDKPYRVRIYKITQRNENEFVSEIYTLRNEKDWIGKWNDPLAFEKLYENELDPKQGCEVVLKRIEKNKFSGQTGIKTCASELRGATYATSKVFVSTDQILSWDQGFDKDGKQVWGAVKSGYIFEK